MNYISDFRVVFVWFTAIHGSYCPFLINKRRVKPVVQFGTSQ